MNNKTSSFIELLAALERLPKGPSTTRFEDIDGWVHGMYNEQDKCLYVSQELFDLIKRTLPKPVVADDMPMFKHTPIIPSTKFPYKKDGKRQVLPS